MRGSEMTFLLDEIDRILADDVSAEDKVRRIEELVRESRAALELEE